MRISRLLPLAVLTLVLAPLPAHAGDIVGTVTVRERPQRQAANRYPGGAAAAHAIAPLPMVAFLQGPAGGQGARTDLRMAQRDTAFTPGLLIVPVGSTVSFPNQDPFFHNVFSYSRAQRFDLGRYRRGESKSVTFGTPGVVKVLCEVHRWMRGAVVVTENPHHAVVDAQGRFEIRGVPAGSYRLTVWDFDRGEQTVQVVVPAQGSVRVSVTL